MSTGMIIEIAVIGIGSLPLPTALQEYGITWPAADQYWRMRWIDGDEEVDHDMCFDDLRGMASKARSVMDGGEAVVWRYYETGVDV